MVLLYIIARHDAQKELFTCYKISRGKGQGKQFTITSHQCGSSWHKEIISRCTDNTECSCNQPLVSYWVNSGAAMINNGRFGCQKTSVLQILVDDRMSRNQCLSFGSFNTQEHPFLLYML